MVDAEELNLGELRLLETDNRIVLPVGVAVRVLVTSDHRKTPTPSPPALEGGLQLDSGEWLPSPERPPLDGPPALPPRLAGEGGGAVDCLYFRESEGRICPQVCLC